MTPQLLAGYTARPAVREDAEAVLSLLHAVTRVVSGEVDNSLKDLLDEWDDPDLNLTRDSRVVLTPDGRLIAYALLWSKTREALPFADIFLHPDEWETDALTERFLLAWAEARAWENVPALDPSLRVALRIYCDSREARLLGIFASEGYPAIRYSFRMGITFDGPPEPGALPASFTLRVVEKEDDPLPVLDAFLDAWRDHFGYLEIPYEERLASWQHHWNEQFEPGLWLLAMDGETVAGICLNFPRYGEDETAGFIEIVAVRRAYRRRGLAEAMLRASFAALYAAGNTSACLFVDGESLTGATRLYERVGMSVDSRYVLSEKELRPGIDPSTHEVGAAVTVSEAP